MNRAQDLKQNFLSVDRKIAMSSQGDYFRVGDTVKHEGASDTESAVIKKFTIDRTTEEVKAYTTKGHCHIDFLYCP